MANVVVVIYRNRRNSNKYLEVKYYKCGHQMVRQYLEWSNGVRNYTGDGKFHRWSKKALLSLLNDYYKVV